jgi:hypothetical protein
MRLPGLFRFRKYRKYPIKRDSEGRSLRARCFELFEEGKRPVAVAEELGIKKTTVFRYFHDWQRLGPDFDKQYAFVKALFKKDTPDRDNNIEIFSRILSKPHGLRRFLTGKLNFPVNADADHKRNMALQLGSLISDHLINNGGKYEDVCYALQHYMREYKRYREDVDADIKEENKFMAIVHTVLAADMEKEHKKRVKPDRLSEEERNAIIRLGIEREMKSTEILYWLSIGGLKAGGLTTEQAREKIYQDLVEKSDLKVVNLFREFQDKVHPLKAGDQSPPSVNPQPPPA